MAASWVDFMPLIEDIIESLTAITLGKAGEQGSQSGRNISTLMFLDATITLRSAGMIQTI